MHISNTSTPVKVRMRTEFIIEQTFNIQCKSESHGFLFPLPSHSAIEMDNTCLIFYFTVIVIYGSQTKQGKE